MAEPTTVEPGAAPLPVQARAPATYAEAVERYLTSAGISASSARVYRVSLTGWAWLLVGTQPPTGRGRRGAVPLALPLADLDDPDAGLRLVAAVADRATTMDADTLNRELSIVRAAITWWRTRGWITGDPTAGIRRRPAPPDRTRALSVEQIDALWHLDAGLREKTLWRLLYESATRESELLCLNVEDLDMANKRGAVIAKGGAVEWIHWMSGTAQLLPRLLGTRRRGPVFLTDRKAPARTPTLDICPTTGHARLSYRRAAELFEHATRALAHPDTPKSELAAVRGWTLHQLRHSALTHDADAGTSTVMLLARSRHASIRSLERYARPGVDAVAAHVARRDPGTRRRSITT